METNPILAHRWFRGSTDTEALRYVQRLVDRDGTVEFWAAGRTAVRQMKRVGALVERDGLAVMYEYRPDPGTQSRQFGIRVARSLLDFRGSVSATRTDGA